MAQDVSIVIREDGTLVVLDNVVSHCFRDVGEVHTKRASHVEPNKKALRLVFHMLRLVFGDKGWMATFTRYWPCLWRVNTGPVGGPILAGRWKNRQAAIEAEVEWLNEHLE
jgi:hypothetical protein